MDKEILPDKINCLILPGTILLPGSKIPVHITSPIMIDTINQSLKSDRMIGIIQSQTAKSNKIIYPAGTLGKITTFVENKHDNYLVLVTGLKRFEVIEELNYNSETCILKVDYNRYDNDYGNYDNYSDEAVLSIEREKLLEILHGYLTYHQIPTNIEDLIKVSDNELVSILTLICPFEPQEKQAILESPSLQNRCEIINALMEITFMKMNNKNFVKH